MLKIFKFSQETSALIYFLFTECQFKWIKISRIH